MRARSTVSFSQELFEDIVRLVESLETLPSDELCSLERIAGESGETLSVRARGEEIGRLRVAD